MNLDNSNFELIDNSNVLIRLDFDYKNYDLVLTRDDLFQLDSLDTLTEQAFVSKKGISFKLLDNAMSFSYSVPNGVRLDVYPSFSKFRTMVSDALSRMGL